MHCLSGVFSQEIQSKMQKNKSADQWPSTIVARGGVFNIPKFEYSKETHDFIKLLMEEQKMSMMQRNKINSYLRSGEPLPITKPKRVTRTNCRPGIDFMLVKAAKRRTISAIKASGDLDREPYVPKPSESWERKKIQLQEQMSGFKHFTPEDERNMRKNKATAVDIGNEAQIDPVDELLQEIQERLDWIEEMDKLGEGHKYKQTIQNEIAERLRLIKDYDSKST